MIFVHPEDKCLKTQKALIEFIKGFKPESHLNLIHEQMHFPGDRWQNPTCMKNLATYIAKKVKDGEYFIIHFDSDINYKEYSDGLANDKFKMKLENFNKLKEKIETILSAKYKLQNTRDLLRNVIYMISFTNLESWLFVNRRKLKSLIDKKCIEHDGVKDILSCSYSKLENINVKTLSKVLKNKEGKSGKDVFNLELCLGYPYRRAIWNLKSINDFYLDNQKILKFKRFKKYWLF
jgi:hypothetical protein